MFSPKNHFSFIIFARYSTREQILGSSEQRQLEHCRALCALYSLPIEREMVAKGKSAFTGKHREMGEVFGEFEAEVRDGMHAGKVLVIEQLDRISRLKPRTALRMMEDLMDNGVSIMTCDGRFYEAYKDFDTFEVMTILIEFETAYKHSKDKSDRLKASYDIRRRKAAETGRLLTRNLPLWLQAKDGKAVAREERVQILFEIFNRMADGDGAQTLEKDLNRRKVPAWDKRKNRLGVWNRTYISRLIRNRAVLGEYHPHHMVDGKRVPTGEVIECFPQVIPPDLFERANNMATPKKEARGRSSKRVVNLLSGLVRCDGCNTKLQYRKHANAGTHTRKDRNGRVYSYTTKHDAGSLYCPLHQSRPDRCSNGNWLAYQRFEKAVLDAVLPLALDDNFYRQRGEVGALTTQVAEAERKLKLAKDRAKAFWRAWGDAQSKTAMELAKEADGEVKVLTEALAGLQKRLKLASGRVGAAEHLKRVTATRALLYIDDPEVRVRKRAQVAAALTSVIAMIAVDNEGRALGILAGGFGGFEIIKGKVTKQRNLLPLLQDAERLSRGNESIKRSVEGMMRRLATQTTS